MVHKLTIEQKEFIEILINYIECLPYNLDDNFRIYNITKDGFVNDKFVVVKDILSDLHWCMKWDQYKTSTKYDLHKIIWMIKNKERPFERWKPFKKEHLAYYL